VDFDRLVDSTAELVSDLQIFVREPAANTPGLQVANTSAGMGKSAKSGVKSVSAFRHRTTKDGFLARRF